MKNILKHIKENSFSKAYLLYGEEDFLKKMYKDKIIKAISGDDTMNLSFFEGKDVPVDEIGDLSRTMPFFAERRLIVIEDGGLFKSSQESLTDIVKNAPDTTFFLFVEKEVDKRNRLYKAVNDVGYVCELKTQTEEALTEWAGRFFRNEGIQISRNDLNYFVAKTGPDMNNIDNEARKLAAYACVKGSISREDIENVCVTRTADRVFDMINAMAARKTDQVMSLYGDLLALKEPPMKILALIGRQFSQLLSIKSMAEEGKGSSEIAARLGIRPYFMGRYMSQVQSYTMKELKEAVKDCVNAENDIKSGRQEEKYAVELLIVKYSMDRERNI